MVNHRVRRGVKDDVAGCGGYFLKSLYPCINNQEDANVHNVEKQGDKSDRKEAVAEKRRIEIACV